MLGSPVPATATIHTTTSSATSSSPSRPSRLRGLSYLRSYTRDHLHSSSSSPARADAPPLIRASSSPTITTRTRAHSDLASAPAVPNTRTAPTNSGTERDMTRNRATTASGPTAAAAAAGGTIAQDVTISSARPSQQDVPPTTTNSKETHPTIRFIPHIETRSSRPSLQFTTLSRTLKTANTIVRVGRYSERDAAMPDDNVLPVGFKSKVVSRRHCEFWCTNGQWYIKDVKSSSGTFLNHVRLSAPGAESRPFPVNDGDVVQLGIDFKGGEEVIFRCVKIRIECNRGWQKSLNNFNTSTHKRLLGNAIKAKPRDSDAASVNSSECSICLNPVSPCQALFVAPCSHVWHYKCIRNLIHSPSYPNFLCPNCRFVADLDADVEPLEDDFEDDEASHASDESMHDRTDRGITNDDPVVAQQTDENRPNEQISQNTPQPAVAPRTPANPNDLVSDEENNGLLDETSINIPTAPPQISSSSSSTTHANPEPARPTFAATQPLDIVMPTRRMDASAKASLSSTPDAQTQFALATGGISADLMTPRNDAGPFVLDGSAGRDGVTALARQPVAEEPEPSPSP